MLSIGNKILTAIRKTRHKKWLYAILMFLATLFLWPVLLSAKLDKQQKYAWLGIGAIVINLVWLLAILAPKQPQQSTKPVVNTTPQTQSQATSQKPAEPAKPTLYKIVEVVDGDTIKVNYNGKTETVRLIGLDTPEIVDPRQPVQCFGQEASDHAKALLTGKSVQLEADGSQTDRDKYSRLLRYAILEDNTNFNKQMIADGYAYEYTYEVPYKYQQDFKAAQTAAQNNSKGLWAAGTCNGQRTKPQPPAAPAPTSTPTATPGTGNCVIKGNISTDDGEKIYHMPGQQYYDKTKIDTRKGERWFCSETEAQAAGWRKSKV